MYLYVELWKPKEAWLKLAPSERQDKLDSMLQTVGQNPGGGIIPFSFHELGESVVFDGSDTQPVVLDASARPTGFHYAAAWMVPTYDLIKPFENRFEKLRWWFEYFDQENAWGEMDATRTLDDMIRANKIASQDGFEGSKAGEERNDFCWCPPGTFKMGFDGTEVTLTQGFWMAKYEVTQKTYLSVVDRNPSAFVGDSLPVDSVSREQVLEFSRRLTRRDQLAGRIPDNWEYNLPTEAQWEYAARAGTTTRFPWGDDQSQADAYSWHMFNSGSMSHPVGQKKPNAWGLYDMLGNCLERCRDAWVDHYPGGTDPDVTPDDVPPRPDEAEGRWGVCRGGGWFIPPLITPADRTRLHPGNQGYLLGFRIAIVPITSPKQTTAQQRLLEWGIATMGHWVTDVGPAKPPTPTTLAMDGFSSARFLRSEDGLEGQFQVGGLRGNFVTMWDRKSEQIIQHTVNSDGGSGQTIISKEGDLWIGKETAVYPNGTIASSTDIVTLSDSGMTMEHHITKRLQNDISLPDLRFVLHRVSN